MDARQRLVTREGRLPGLGRLGDPAFKQAETALLIVDMQYLDAHPDYGLVARMKAQGVEDVCRYYTERLRVVLPNIQSLLHTFRRRRMEVIYTVIESLAKDGRDRSLEHKRLNIFAPPGSKEAQVLEEIAPGDDEIILKKTCGSVFHGTPLHYILCNLGIRTLVVCGVVTSGCVESAVRDASNLSYEVVVPEDACATWSQEMQDASIYVMREVYAKVYTTEELLERVQAMVPHYDVSTRRLTRGGNLS